MNKLTLQMPYQLFIGGEFVDAEGSKTYNTINPTDGSVSRTQPPSFCPPQPSPGTVARVLGVCALTADRQGLHPRARERNRAGG